MAEETQPTHCLYCWHPFHGRAESSEGFATPMLTMTSTTQDGRCQQPLSDVRNCNCDGRSQWFSSPVMRREHALEWCVYAQASGYTAYIFNSADITIQVVGVEGIYLDGCKSCVFSETLPPVASVQEFEERCHMPAHLRWPEKEAKTA